MKKKLAIVFVFCVLLLFAYFIVPGFIKCGTIYIQDFNISDNGNEITIDIGNAASVGNVRKAAVYQQEGGKLYIDFYHTFGGINSSIGAKNRFTLPLQADTDIISVYRTANTYEEIFKKDSNGIWRRD